MSRILNRLIVAALVLSGFLALPAIAEEPPFGGVGLQVVPTINGELVVLNVLKDAPASEEMLPGDLIFQVDDFPLQGSDFGKVISEHLWGPVGSSVEIFFRRPGIVGVGKVTLQRSTIDPRLTVTPSAQNGSAVSVEGN